MIKTGLENFFDRNSDETIKSMNFGILCNHAAIDSDFNLLWEKMLKEGYNLKTIFGPQHGLFPITQDNMIEWEGYYDSEKKVNLYSLYGENRKPTDEMMDGLEIVLIDLPDIGTRYYTFAWSMLLMMEKCAEKGVKVIILDRPNPINGINLEGPILNMEFKSFVGLAPIIVRHGLTLGELAIFFKKKFKLDIDLEVIKCSNWKRQMYFDETDLPWVIPSPNMPTLEAAIVYPGMCLLEATNISEGRGTTRPFTIFGAPFIEQDKFLAEISKYKLKGIKFRKHNFMPMFQKYKDEICNGFEIYVTDRCTFDAFLSACAIIKVIFTLYPDKFQWKSPPYEYEFNKLPIDILLGDIKYRETLENSEFEEFVNLIELSKRKFIEEREDYLIYE